MKSYGRMFKSTWLSGLLAGVITVSAGPASLPAQDTAPVRLESVHDPFNPFAVENAWTELTATVINDSPAPRRVRVTYLAPTQGKQTLYTRLAELPPRTDLRLAVGAYLNNLKPTGRPLGERKYDEIQDTYVLNDAQTGQELGRIPDSRGCIPPHILPLLRIGGSVEDSSGTAEFKALIDGAFREFQSVQLRIPNLPDRWYGYSGGGMVLLGEASLGGLRLSQRQALLQYVRRGGVLLIVGNENLGEMLRGEMGEAAGVRVLGFHKTLSVELPSPSGPAKRTLDRPATMVELCPDQAEVVFQTEGLPLLTKNPLGRGWVFVLAVPPLVVNESTLRVVEQTRATLGPLNEDEFAQPAKGILNQIAGRPGPPRRLPVLVLLGLGALVLVGGAAARFRGRGEWVWLTLVPLALAVAVGMYAYGKSRSRNVQERLSTVGMVSGLGDGLVRAQQVFAYGGPTRQTATFTTDTYSGILTDMGEMGALGEVQEIRSGPVMSMPDQILEPDSTRAFRVEEILPAGDVVSRLTFGPKGLTGTLRNALGRDLHDAVLYVNQRSFAVGPLPQGQAQTIEGVGREAKLAPGEFTTGMLHDVLKNSLLQQMAAAPSLTHPVSRQPLLIAKMDGGLLSPLDPPGLTRTGWSVAVWPLTIVPPDKGSQVQVPPGFVRTQIRMGERWGLMTGEVSDSRTSEIGLRGLLPPQVTRLKDAKATLTLRLRGGNYKMTLSGGAPGGPKVVLQQKDGPTGEITVEAPQAERFESADGAFEFTLQMELMGAQDAAPPPQWTLESADITLEGISTADAPGFGRDRGTEPAARAGPLKGITQ